MSSISFITRSVSGPIAPTPCIAIGREAGDMQDFEPCMLLEQIASALTKSGKIARKRSSAVVLEPRREFVE